MEPAAAADLGGRLAEIPNISRPSTYRKGIDSCEGDLDEIRALVEDAKRGDREAFGTLYRTYHARIYRLARFHLGRAGADDAAAETFVRAWTALPRFRDRGLPFVAWLYGIARHVVADELKARKRRSHDEVPDQRVDADRDDRLQLAAAIAKLPDEQRRVIELKYVVGLKNPEVADILGKTVGAVNAQQWRALQSLRGMVER